MRKFLERTFGIFALFKFFMMMRSSVINNGDGHYLFMEMGTTFWIFGAWAVYFHFLQDKEISKSSCIFTCIGIAISTYCGWMLHENRFHNVHVPIAPGLLGCVVFILLLLFMIGLGFIILPKSGLSLQKERCSEKVSGVCIDIKTEVFGARKKKLYSPIYEIYINGEYHQLNSERYDKFEIPIIGQRYELFVNPDDLSDYIEARAFIEAKILTRVGIGIVIIIGIIGLVLADSLEIFDVFQLIRKVFYLLAKGIMNFTK